MNENHAQPHSGKGPWWFGWLLATVIIPGATFGLLVSETVKSEVVWGTVALVTFVMHIVSSVKLGRGRSGWLTAGLVVGGWGLMLVSVFVGCLAVVSLSPQ